MVLTLSQYDYANYGLYKNNPEPLNSHCLVYFYLQKNPIMITGVKQRADVGNDFVLITHNLSSFCLLILQHCIEGCLQ